MRNSDPEEWASNLHSMMVMGAMGERSRTSSLLFLPKPIRSMVEWTLAKIQGFTRALRSWSKLNFNTENIARLNQVKDYVDGVRQSFRKAETKRLEASDLLSTSPDQLMERFARSRFGPTGAKDKFWEKFDNAMLGAGDLARLHSEFKEPVVALTRSNDTVMEGVVSGLAPLLGKRVAFGDFKADPSMPIYKIIQSKPLYDLINEIVVTNQLDPQSLLVKQADGGVAFDWSKLTPTQRAKLKMYSPESQKLAQEFLMQRESAVGNIQDLIVNQVHTGLVFNLARRIAKMPSYLGEYKDALQISTDVMNMLEGGDPSYLGEFAKKFGDPLEAQSVMESAQDWLASKQKLEQFYKDRPNFQSLRRFGKFVQRYAKPGEESRVLDFQTREEAVKYTKQLEAEGWKPDGPVKERDKESQGRVVVEDKVRALIEEMEGKLKESIESLPLDEDVKNELRERSNFATDVEREVKAGELYLPGVKRRVSGDPLNLDLMQQHILYTKAAAKVSTSKAVQSQMDYLLSDPKFEGKPAELKMFKKILQQSQTSDPKFWRNVMKANAVWHIGFNIPGHVVEAFQPITSHVHELIAQGHGVVGSTKMIAKTFKDVGVAYAKLAKDKIGKSDEAFIWDKFKDQGEREMLEELWPRFMRAPLKEINEVIGENSDNFRRAANGEKMLTTGEAFTKPFSMYSNAAMGMYSLPVRFNALSGLLTGYRMAKKKGLSHEQAVREAELFEQSVNNSGGRMERPAYFSKFGDAGYLVYALSSYVRGRFNQFARYYRHGFDSSYKPDLTPAQRADARKAFGVMIGAQLGAAGLLGFPLVGSGMAIMEDVLNEDIKGKALANLNDVTGDETLTRALSHGVMSTMAENLGIPADLQSRFALSGFLGLNSYDGLSASSVLGPTASMVKSMWNFGKAIAQEPDIGKALQAGGPQSLKRVAEALSEEYKTNNPESSPAMSILGFRSGQSFKRKEMEQIISKQQAEDSMNMSRAAERVKQSLSLGPQKAQEALFEEAQKMLSPEIKGHDRLLALKFTMQQLRQKVVEETMKQKVPQDLRSSGTPRTSPVLEAVARAIGYQPPQTDLVGQEMEKRNLYGLMGQRRSAAPMRTAFQHQQQLNMEPNSFY